MLFCKKFEKLNVDLFDFLILVCFRMVSLILGVGFVFLFDVIVDIGMKIKLLICFVNWIVGDLLIWEFEVDKRYWCLIWNYIFKEMIVLLVC